MSFRVGVKLSSNETSSHRTVLIMKPSTGSFNFMHNSQIWYKSASILTRNAFHLQCYSVDIFFQIRHEKTRDKVANWTNQSQFILFEALGVTSQHVGQVNKHFYFIPVCWIDYFFKSDASENLDEQRQLIIILYFEQRYLWSVNGKWFWRETNSNYHTLSNCWWIIDFDE